MRAAFRLDAVVSQERPRSPLETTTMIETDRLRLRPHVADDLSASWAMWSDTHARPSLGCLAWERLFSGPMKIRSPAVPMVRKEREMIMSIADTAAFTTTFTVDQTPGDAFAAISNPREWWSEEIAGNTDTLDGEFTYRYNDAHHCTMRVVEAVPGRKLVWLVVDNYFSFTEDKSEWKGTEIVFDISRKDDKTDVRFTHRGLVREYECFDVCSNAWGSYINGSLRSLITTGTGQPNTP
jgi:hypothetical protein